jgi:site-specific DNA recombinase
MRTVAYARYSTEMQRAASITDQLRNIRQRCEREGWADPVVYSDEAISGARSDRPQFLALIADADKFDVLLVDDLSRLSRDKDDTGKALKRLAFSGVRVIGVSDGTDTARDGHELDTGIRAVISEHYLRELAGRTHRGLTGRALNGASAGGLPYGYRVTEIGARAIDESQAVVVRRIYAEFLAGRSPRNIAAGLNADRVLTARGNTWAQSAIHGDTARGIGILANPIYIGRQIWNRSRWIKHPDTGRRLRKERPKSEWIVTEHPELEIVDRATWEFAQAKLRNTGAIGRNKGRTPFKNLLSGILRCPTCGGPFVVVDAYCYGCAAHKDRGDAVCADRLLLRRAKVEKTLLAGVREELLSEEACKRAERYLREALQESAPDLAQLKATLANAEREHANIVAALRAGIITPTTKAELESTEAALERAKSELDEAQAYRPAQMVPRARELWRAAVATLETATDVPETRIALAAIIGERVPLVVESGNVYAELLNSQMAMVAGAGFGRHLRTAVRVLLMAAP